MKSTEASDGDVLAYLEALRKLSLDHPGTEFLSVIKICLLGFARSQHSACDDPLLPLCLAALFEAIMSIREVLKALAVPSLSAAVLAHQAEDSTGTSK